MRVPRHLRHPARRAWGAGLSLAGSLGAGAAACSTPSESVDGGDLLGVFTRDAGADGRSEAGPGRDGGRKDAPAPVDAGGDGSPTVEVRAPIEGVCVLPQGTPAQVVHRPLGRPACRDAQVLEWRDGEGAPRYACAFSPHGAETRAPLPLVIFFHAPFADPTMVDKQTTLRKLGATFSLTGEAAHLGFLVLAVQGRAFKGAAPGTFDTEFTGPDAVELATVDHFVGELTARNLVDLRRVYALGASSGGQMAATYAMMRADRIAAFGAFAADQPRAPWACPGPPPPAMIVYRACDSFFSCEAVERWLRQRDGQGAETAWLRLGAGNEPEPNCAFASKCTELKGTSYHRRWPKGREEDFLRFFALHLLARE